MSLVPLIDDRSARIAARKRLRMLSSAAIDDGDDLERKGAPKPPQSGIVVEPQSIPKAATPVVSDATMLRVVRLIIGPAPALPPFLVAPIYDAHCGARNAPDIRCHPTVFEIQKAVVQHFEHITFDDIISDRRMKSIVYPRQIAMYLAKELTPMSLASIAARFGGRDHTTVIHGWRKIAELRKTDGGLDALIRHISEELTGAPIPMTGAAPAVKVPLVPTQDIIERIGQNYSMAPERIVSYAMDRESIFVRSIAMYLGVEVGWSCGEVGKAFGGRSRASAALAHRSVAGKRLSDAALNSRISSISAELMGADA